MARTIKILDWIGVIFINVALTFLSVGLQFLMYAFAPSIDPNTSTKKIACIEAAGDFNRTLYIELIFGSVLIFLFSRKLLQPKIGNPNQLSFLFLISYLVVCVLTMHYFSDDYIRRCIGS